MTKKFENLNGKLSIEMANEEKENIEEILFFDIFNKKKIAMSVKGSILCTTQKIVSKKTL
eukprot:Pgem_evm1s10699